MSDQGGSGPAAGWYPDPEVPGGQRYWDGSQWGEQRPPAGGGPAGGPPPWPSTPSAGQPAWSQSTPPGTPPTSSIDPWFWQSIVATVLCCLPFGVVAIVKSTQAKSAIDVGDSSLARRRADEARTWTLIAAGLGLLVYVIYLGAVASFV